MRLPPRFKRMEFVGDRHNFIINYVRKKVVLHLGCAQHSDSPPKNLHVKLCRICKECWGIDVDEKGISVLHSTGIQNLVVGRAEEAHRLLSNRRGYFEVILVPEVLEHVGDPLNILKSVRPLLRDDGVLLVTGPNSFGLRRTIWALIGREAESPGHRFTFHPSGLELLTRDASFTIEKRFSAIESSHVGGIRHTIANAILVFLFRAFPYFADSVGVICTK